ncbi:Versicolorin B synthase [Grifola frondosa]|uniref:Versicolorin B synthase n=1 Tax=Grifola frondosa TaxID=5627 RepID=A0A1C7MAG2_GRIFR|nr:Versicolorin B synthase [Grifola frondosa]
MSCWTCNSSLTGLQPCLHRASWRIKRHLPTVGANVQDHLILTVFVFEMRMGNEIITSDTIRDPKFQSKLREAYGDVGGLLALAQTEKFAREAETYPPGLKEQYAVQLEMLKKENVPDIEVVVFPFSLKPDDSGRPFVGLLPSIGHPFSRGTIHVASADPKAQPEIEPNYLAEQIDLETLVDAFKFLRKWMWLRRIANKTKFVLVGQLDRAGVHRPPPRLSTSVSSIAQGITAEEAVDEEFDARTIVFQVSDATVDENVEERLEFILNSWPSMFVVEDAHGRERPSLLQVTR